MRVNCDWHARVATLACKSHVYRHETRAVAPETKARPSLWTCERPPTDLWWLTNELRPLHDRPEFSQVVASKIRMTYESKDRRATNLWLYLQFSRVCSRVGPRPYKYGREQWGVISMKPAWDLWSYVDPMSLLCRSYVTPMSILCHSYVDPMLLTSYSLVPLAARMSLLCDSAKVATLEKFQEWLAPDFASDIYTSHRVTYDQFVRDLQPTYAPAPSWPLGKSFPTVLSRSIRSGNLCRAMASPPELLPVSRSTLRPSDK